MTFEELKKIILKKANDAELIKDTPTSFRVFIYSQKSKFPITAAIDRTKNFKITKISDYPKQKQHYPICVVRVERLPPRKSKVKRKAATTNILTKTNIKSNSKSITAKKK